MMASIYLELNKFIFFVQEVSSVLLVVDRLYLFLGTYKLIPYFTLGSFCNNGALNFTLCPKGTYQPMRGQSFCIRCPVGYMCPEEGLPVPR